MPNRAIRAQQSANSKKLAEDGLPLIRQTNFPRPTKPVSGGYGSNQEAERRRAQITRGQLTEANGLQR